MNIELARGDDLPAVRALLEKERLPTSDLDEQALKRFLVLRDGVRVDGFVGFELYGEVALLRSLVVAAHVSGRGAGTALMRAAERLAAQSGATRIYLLTTSAERFFLAHGYRKIDRATAPPSIQHTRQFSALCPSSAIVMAKSLL